jgi:hypothetical protein
MGITHLRTRLTLSSGNEGSEVLYLLQGYQPEVKRVVVGTGND